MRAQRKGERTLRAINEVFTYEETPGELEDDAAKGGLEGGVKGVSMANTVLQNSN